MNAKKTNSMIMSKTPKTKLPSEEIVKKKVKLNIGGELIEKVEHFCYLGSDITKRAV